MNNEKSLSDWQLVALARKNNIEPAMLKAFAVVESAGSGFLPDGRCKILFEGHVFWRQLINHGVSPENYTSGNQDILHPSWDKSKYRGGAAEYLRLERAMNIHRKAALMSASYGMFQIMGFNHKYCGYPDVENFVANMNKSEYHQLMAVVEYLKQNGFIPLFNQHLWSEIARRYNGPAYAKNNYHIRLQQAYQQNKPLNA